MYAVSVLLPLQHFDFATSHFSRASAGSLPRPSPQKPQRTLDNKIISRELERLGLGVSHIHGGASSSTLVSSCYFERKFLTQCPRQRRQQPLPHPHFRYLRAALACLNLAPRLC